MTMTDQDTVLEGEHVFAFSSKDLSLDWRSGPQREGRGWAERRQEDTGEAGGPRVTWAGGVASSSATPGDNEKHLTSKLHSWEFPLWLSRL